MNMKLLEVVTPLSIYNGCSTWKVFREENFTPANMKKWWSSQYSETQGDQEW